VYVLYYILCVDKDYIFSKDKFYLPRLCSSCISTLRRFVAPLSKYEDDKNEWNYDGIHMLHEWEEEKL
jgi:hypothetical protein